MRVKTPAARGGGCEDVGRTRDVQRSAERSRRSESPSRSLNAVHSLRVQTVVPTSYVSPWDMQSGERARLKFESQPFVPLTTELDKTGVPRFQHPS